MPFCPDCNGEMDERAVVCPHCGYDFPPEPESPQQRNKIWADLVLVMGALVAAFACVRLALYSFLAISEGEYLRGLVDGPMGILVSLALLITFIRVQKL
jgi:hypothetical protein